MDEWMQGWMDGWMGFKPRISLRLVEVGIVLAEGLHD
jgi:hypothetical protein